MSFSLVAGVTRGTAGSASEQFAADVAQVDSTQTTAAEVFDASVSRAELTEACKVSLDFLASLILGEIYQYGYPRPLRAMWQMLCAASLETLGKPKYAIGIPRGFSKTILLKLYVVWLVLFSDRKFVLVICNTATHANNFIADVADMLDNSNIIKIFGNWRAGIDKSTGIDRQDLKKFSFRGRDIIIAAMGAGSSPRGLNIKFVRPDIILMDDMQNKEEASNAEIAKEQLDWMLGTLMMACHPQRCVFVFVGNMYPFEGSILRKLKHSTSWIAFITGAILADGTSIWPEHRSIDDLLGELAMLEEQGRPELFYAEVMNDEEGGTVSGIDVSKIKLCPEELDATQAQGGAVIIDPSGKKNTSDATAIGAFLVFDGIPIYWEVIEKRLDPGETIQQATFLAIKYGMQLIVVEDVAYQSTLCYWFEKIWEMMGVGGVEIGTVSTGGLAKNARLRSWCNKLLSGSNMLHPQVRSRVVYQITQWNPLKNKNVDDVMDVGSYMDEVVAKYQQFMPLMIQAAVEEQALGAHTGDLALAF